MKTKNTGDARKVGARMWAIILAIVLLGALAIPAAVAQVPEPARAASHGGGEASLVLPDLGQVSFRESTPERF
jgi:hypothetical protein